MNDLTDVELDKLSDYYERVSEKHQFKTIWSVYEVSDLRRQAFPDNDATKLVYMNHWGPKPVDIKLPKKPSWLTLWKCADKLIAQSGDNHHIFIEQFRINPENGVVFLYTGS